MTAITSTSRHSSSRVSNICNDYTVEIYDFDNDVHTYDVSAHSQAEAGSIASALAQRSGIDVSYALAYLYD